MDLSFQLDFFLRKSVRVDIKILGKWKTQKLYYLKPIIMKHLLETHTMEFRQNGSDILVVSTKGQNRRSTLRFSMVENSLSANFL